METRSSQTDVVVIGGGMAGLTAACYLARAQMEVTVIEKASYLGGRAATQDFDGFRFNRGGHALYTGGAASRILEELGVSYEYGIPKRTFVMQGGKLSPFPADPLGFLRTNVLNAVDKLALVRLLVALGAAKPQALAKTSVQGWLDQNVRRPQLRRLMTETRAHLRLQHGAGPRQCGAVRREVATGAQAPGPLRRRRMGHAGGRVARCGEAGRGTYR